MTCARCGVQLPENACFCPHCGKRQSRTATVSVRRRRRPKGSGTVYKLTGTRARPWVARASDGTVIGTYASSGEAIVSLDEVNAKKLAARSATRTFSEVYEAWSAVHFQGISASAENSYRNAYAKAKPLWARKMQDLKTEDYQQIIEKMRKQNASRSLCEKQRQLFSQLCQYAMQNDIIHTNYASGLRLPAQKGSSTRILSEAEIQKIWSVSEDKRLGETARITLALLYTGMRLNELLLARVENFNQDERILVAGEKTEAGRNRAIPIPDKVFPLFCAWAGDRKGGYLIASQYGGPRDHNNVRKSFSILMKKLGIEGVHPHTCRHTAATRMLDAGIPPRIVSQILGHADITTTLNIYDHPNVEELKKAVQKIG